ncbi:MAG TPA: MOSC N-terminal beta barrel domain-containing protein [Usitatibacter sp.]|nr:MOSC N-terminal beta barrel domain-containing protein [Usitatibacter sp.]
MLSVSALNVYPVKGLKGISVTEARATERGLEHDRRWMVVDGEGDFLSQREHPRMATIWTEIDDGRLVLSAPDRDAVEVPIDPTLRATRRVRVWSSVVDAAAVPGPASAWLSDYLGIDCALVYMPEETERESRPEFAGEGRLVGFADAFAYLLLGEASLADLNARLLAKGHKPLPMNRFRPNLVVSGGAAYAEDTWGDVQVGDALLRTAKACGRCQVTTTDQATGEVRGPEPLATLSSYRNHPEYGPLFGMNLVTLQAGTVRVGDIVDPLDPHRRP